jgi:ABC-type bacteriocin/lantibiotic exporter with double-glycine peptidase domain
MKPVGVWKVFLCGCLLSGVLSPLAAVADAAEDQPVAAVEVDCGLASLYLLLRLEGHPVALPSLASQLPPLPAEGHSLRDLRDVARGLGLRVTGMLLPTGQPAPRSTCLAFVNRGGHGHFLVLRPVGHTGKLVQVFDGLGGPVVLDWTNLRGSPEWTGLVLLTDQTSAWPRIASVLVLAGGLSVVLAVPRLRRRRADIA